MPKFETKTYNAYLHLPRSVEIGINPEKSLPMNIKNIYAIAHTLAKTALANRESCVWKGAMPYHIMSDISKFL